MSTISKSTTSTTNKRNSTSSANRCAVEQIQAIAAKHLSRQTPQGQSTNTRLSSLKGVKYNTKTLAKALILELLSLEQEVIAASLGDDEAEVSACLKTLNRVFKNLLLQKFNKNYYAYAFCLFNRVLQSEQCAEKLPVSPGDVTKIYCVCFFIAFKMLEDCPIMFTEDLSTLTGYSVEMIEALEKVVLTDVLGWSAWVTKKEVEVCKAELITEYLSRKDE